MEVLRLEGWKGSPMGMRWRGGKGEGMEVEDGATESSAVYFH
jgi:hypothetical protein